MMEQIIKKTVENLNKNNMQTFLVDSRDEVVPLLKTLIPKGASIGVGGSVTLNEVGAIELVRSEDYSFFDRYDPKLTREQALEVMAKALNADVFLSSSNAVTENGELYNVDGNGNRIAAFCFGPKQVIVIVGVNKIVPNIDAAVKRVKEIAAPKNTVRLSCNTPCAKTGKCVSLMKENSEMCEGCRVEDRICASYLVTGNQRNKDRIKVIICKEDLGY